MNMTKHDITKPKVQEMSEDDLAKVQGGIGTYPSPLPLPLPNPIPIPLPALPSLPACW